MVIIAATFMLIFFCVTAYKSIANNNEFTLVISAIGIVSAVVLLVYGVVANWNILITLR